MNEHHYTIEHLIEEIEREKTELKYSEAAFKLAAEALGGNEITIRHKKQRIIGLEESLAFLISQNNNRR